MLCVVLKAGGARPTGRYIDRPVICALPAGELVAQLADRVVNEELADRNWCTRSQRAQRSWSYTISAFFAESFRRSLSVAMLRLRRCFTGDASSTDVERLSRRCRTTSLHEFLPRARTFLPRKRAFI